MAEGVAAMFGSDPTIQRSVGQTMRNAADQGASQPAAGSQDAAFGPEQVLESPATLLGTIDEMVERLEQRRERWGFNYGVFQGEGSVDSLAPLVARLAGT
jgi:hypothetical protein